MGLKAQNPGCNCCPPAGGAVIAGCICTSIPVTLTMSASPVGTQDTSIFHDATLRWVDTPPEYTGLAIGTKAFLSDESFADFAGTFRYYLFCTRNQFFLTRVYAHSVFGSPFQDSVRYIWTMSVSGNTCTPLFLSTGTVYSGGNPGTHVTVAE
jgi:hypothetical protein